MSFPTTLPKGNTVNHNIKINVSRKKMRKNNNPSSSSSFSSSSPSSNTPRLSVSSSGLKVKRGGITVKRSTGSGRMGSKGGNSAGHMMTIKIKPFANPPKPPPNFYEHSSDLLIQALNCILHHRPLVVNTGNGNSPLNTNNAFACESPKSPVEMEQDKGFEKKEGMIGAVAVTGAGAGASAIQNHGGTISNTSTGTHNTKTTRVSREELYRSVQDLCTHGHGPRLYGRVRDALDHAAATCLQRLVHTNTNTVRNSTTNVNVNNNYNNNYNTNNHKNPNSNGTKITTYPTIGCTSTSNPQDNNAPPSVYFTTLPSPMHMLPSYHTQITSQILENVHSIWTDYITFLSKLRNVFLHLDRTFAYIPTTGDIHPRTNLHRTHQTPTSSYQSSSHTGGRDFQFWGLWELGLHCLWRRMSLVTIPLPRLTHNTMSATKSASAMDIDTDMDMDNHKNPLLASYSTSSSTSSSYSSQKYSVLDALRSCTVTSLLAELDKDNGSLTSSTSLTHSPLLRNCISIFSILSASQIDCTFTTNSATSSITTNTNTTTATVSTLNPTQSSCYTISPQFTNSLPNSISNDGGAMGDFLRELVAMTIEYFTKESRSWMDTSSTASSSSAQAASKMGYDVRAFLLRVKDRIDRVKAITNYHLLPNAIDNHHNGHHPYRQPPCDNQNVLSPSISHPSFPKRENLLANIVDTYLLAPHFTDRHILHPASLYPLLDGDGIIRYPNDSSTDGLEDVRLLFQLSKRILPELMFNMHTHTHTHTNINPPPSGETLLRQAFSNYGHERGLSIVRMKHPGIVTPSRPSSSSSTSHASREAQSQIVPRMLTLKARLEQLHIRAFDSNVEYGHVINGVLENVINSGIGTTGGMGVEANDVAGTAGRRKNSEKVATNASYSLQDGGDGGRRFAELLAKYIDLRFKNPHLYSPHQSQQPIMATATTSNTDDAFQEAALDLFRHLNSKDVFEAFYRRDLAKRLLSNKSASIDREKFFVARLKAECGGVYTSKMEGMFKDVDLSRDDMRSYSAFLSGKGGNKADSVNDDPSSNTLLNSFPPSQHNQVDMDIQVLTTGYWPHYPPLKSLILPPSLSMHKARFDAYYKTKYQGRRIEWQNSLGSCVVSASFPRMIGERDLIVNMTQALVLLCFNINNSDHSGTGPQLTIAEVMKQTGLEDRDEAERALQSLSLGREGTRVLCKINYNPLVDESTFSTAPTTASSSSTPNTLNTKKKKIRKSVHDKDIFIFNHNFYSNQHRIRITNVQMRETNEERNKTQDEVNRDRMYTIDAVAVRIMKARKTLQHTELLGEILNQLKFPARGKDLKKRIESLLEREYIERDEKNRNQYNYLA